MQSRRELSSSPATATPYRADQEKLNLAADDLRGVADAAEPRYASLDDGQKQIFITEMVRLGHERGKD